ncbi:hypothetical protein MMC18_001315 [Xylographa bjoerkii]|nr:hypothetical protein [Xylographa bjoerkii]
MASITRLEPVYLQPQPQQGMSMEMAQSSLNATPTSNTEEQPRLGLRGGGIVSDWCVAPIFSNSVAAERTLTRHVIQRRSHLLLRSLQGAV